MKINYSILNYFIIKNIYKNWKINCNQQHTHECKKYYKNVL